MRRIFRGGRRLWVLTLAVVLVAVLFVAGPVSWIDYSPPQHMSVLLGVLLFVLVELLIVRLHFQKDTQSFTLSEVPVVLGLFMLTPHELIGAQLAGSLVVLAVVRRQMPLKLLFNLGQFALSTGIALTVLHALSGSRGIADYNSWLATGVALVLASLTTLALTQTAISLSQDYVDWGRLPSALNMSLLGTLANTCVGLAMVFLVQVRPIAAALLVVPLVAVYGSYRAYASESRRRERISFLFESSRVLLGRSGTADPLRQMLFDARRIFRCEVGEVVLAGAEDEAEAYRITVGPGDLVESSPVPLDYIPDLVQHLPVSGPSNRQRVSEYGAYGRGMNQRGLHEALVAPLRGDDGEVVGALTLASTSNAINTFGAEDLRLLETLAQHIAMALNNGRLQSQLSRQAYHDALTGLANRAHLTRRIDQALGRLGSGRECACIFVDLDDFKIVNDSLGHAAGDALLVAAADRISRSLRPGDVGARLGGDEFAVLLENLEHHADALAVAERIAGALWKPFIFERREAVVHGSVGVAFAEPGLSADDLLARADLALYRAKARAKGRVEVFSPAMLDAVSQLHALSEELHRAASRQELTVMFQPIVSLATGKPVGAEALIAWEHPTRGLLRAEDFIEVALGSGLEEEIAATVIAGVAEMAERLVPFPGDFFLSLNASARQVSRPAFDTALRRLLDAPPAVPGSVVLEVTEGLLVDEDIRARLRSLREVGVRIAIDDFGTGYSSLAALRDLPFDLIKLPPSFIQGVGRDATAERFTDAVLALGRTLGIPVIAEGVESYGEMAWLSSRHCSMAQGHYFSTSVSAHDLWQSLQDDVDPQAAVGQ
ncbi:MAG: putative bifunctional diguanylate cyclase/phosphodiesterase [Candidatus Dormibacteria bacterium]